MLKVRSSYTKAIEKFLNKQQLFQVVIFNALSLNFSSYLMLSSLSTVFFEKLFFFTYPLVNRSANLIFFLKNIKRNVFSH